MNDNIVTHGCNNNCPGSSFWWHHKRFSDVNFGKCAHSRRPQLAGHKVLILLWRARVFVCSTSWHCCLSSTCMAPYFCPEISVLIPFCLCSFASVTCQKYPHLRCILWATVYPTVFSHCLIWTVLARMLAGETYHLKQAGFRGDHPPW